MNTFLKIFAVSSLVLASAILVYSVVAPESANATNSPQVTFSNTQIYYDANSKVASVPCSLVPGASGGTCDGGYYPDNATATKLCQLKGYDTMASWTPQYGFYTSCGDNFMWQWNGTSANYVWACSMNTGIDTVTCGANVNITCSSNSQCGTNALTGSLFCQGNSVYQNYITYTCNNPGTASSTCSNSTAPQLQSNCTGNQTCSNGSCNTNQSNINVSCYASPNPVNINQQVSFICNVSGGTGSYTYSWSGACTGSSSVCTTSFSYPGTQTATALVTSGSQTNSTSASVTINGNNNYCTQNSYQRCSGNYLYWYDSCGKQQGNGQYCPNGCYNNSCGNNNNNYLTINKTGRNLTTGTGFTTSTSASPSDMLMFMITLQNTGSQDVQNVVVRDTLPANLIYNNQLVVACTTNNSNYSNCNGNNYNNYTGNISNGVNLNTIYAGQTVTITYQVQVASAGNFAYGTTTLTNNVSVTSSNSGYNPASNASVIVNRTAVYGASTVNTGLTNNFWVDSFFLPLMLTLLGIWMWRTGMFFGIEKWISNKKKSKNAYNAEKELQNRIASIQNLEKA
ncbi:MAG: hypothetical protein NT026_01345 [Candidatus Staskawiczbacteria bacterium]|nr:hypothetical protein [Candidatus Staskawiczbacteria bacterium]